MILHGSHGEYLIGPDLPLSTKTGKHIPNEQRMPSPPARMNAARDIVLNGHPSRRVRSLSNVYHCMGLVFASRRTWVGTEYLSMILQEDGYRRILSESELHPGDLIVYKDAEGVSVHVGWITRITPNFRNAIWEIDVVSQWGNDGEYFHPADDVSPFLGTPSEYWTDRI